MQRSIELDTAFNTGNVMEDHEHHEIVRLANLLALTNGTDHSITDIEDTLFVLHRFVELHFKSEETILKAAYSKHLDIQRVQHNLLKQELNAFWAPGNPAPSKQVVLELIVWIDSQLLQHFKINDVAAFDDLKSSSKNTHN